MKLLGYKKLTGKVVVETGLHIGGSQETTQIGGVDNPVIRLPLNNMPFIPGSSLKGKMRSLLELSLDKVDNGNVHTCGDSNCPICCIFGTSASETAEHGPARLIIRDCLVDENHENVKKLLKNSIGLPLSEDKAEVTIDRIRGAAKNGGLRKTERVPAGAVFNLDIAFRSFDGDDSDLFEYVLKGLALIQQDTLGGSGSRGYGKVSFQDLKVDGENVILPGV